MRYATTKFGKTLDEVVTHRTPRKIFPPSVKGGRRAAVLVLGKRGRYVRYRIPVRGSVTDIAIMPTIRAAIMHSIRGKIEIKKTDLREKVRRRKVSILLALVIDGSSSMIEGPKLATVRGLLDDIFIDAYQKRDRMAVIHCGGGKANVLLSFAGNIEVGRQALEKAPWGGTDSLVDGIALAKEVVSTRLRIEKNAIPVVVILSDGLFSRVDIDPINANIEELAKDAGVLCVDLGTEDENAPFLDTAVGHNLGYVRPDEMSEPAELPDIEELRSILTGLSVLLVNPRCGPALMSGYDQDAIGIAANLIQENLWDIQQVKGCPAGCTSVEASGPVSSDHEHKDGPELCPICQTARTSEELQSRSTQFPLVQSSDFDEGSLLGRLFLKKIVRPGLVSRSRAGLLLLTPNVLDARSERALADAYVLQSITPVDGPPMFKLPVGRRIALFRKPVGSEEAQRTDLMTQTSTLLLSMRPDARSSATNIRMKREAILSPGLVLREIRANFAPMLQALKNAVDILPTVVAGEEVMDLISLTTSMLAPREPAFLVRVLEASRAFAALGGRTAVSSDDVRHALTLLLEGSQVSQDLLPHINEVLLDRLDPLLRSLFHDQVGILLRSALPGFAESLRSRLDSRAPVIRTMKGCDMHCSPDGPGGLCPECRLTVQAGKETSSKVLARVVTIGPGLRPADLLSRTYLRKKVVPGKLAHANRGVLLINDLSRLDPTALGLINRAMDEHTAPFADGSMSHPFEASVLAIVEGENEIPRELMDAFSMEIDILEIIDADVVVSAAFRMWNGDKGPHPGEHSESEDPLAQEHMLDLLVRVSAARFPGVPMADLVLLKASRAIAKAKGRSTIGEIELGSAACLFKPAPLSDDGAKGGSME